jgi:hypothetical protein
MLVQSFKTQLKYNPQPDELQRIKSLPTIKFEDIPDLDDDKYEWVQIGNEKFGRFMYCKRNGIKRTQTMGEFYGTTTVD